MVHIVGFKKSSQHTPGIDKGGNLFRSSPRGIDRGSPALEDKLGVVLVDVCAWGNGDSSMLYDFS